jgi:ribose transport system ATP-binding protein
MVEIARAFTVTDTPVKLVILDEPTSSLDSHVAGQLLDFVRRFVADGGAVILISHLLGEILSTATRIVVMRDGKVVAERPAGDFTRDTLVAAMGSVARDADAAAVNQASRRSTASRAFAPGRRRRPTGRSSPPGAARSSGSPASAATARPTCWSASSTPPAAATATPTSRARRADRRRPADRRHLPAVVDRQEHRHRLARRMLRGILIDPRREKELRRGVARAHRHPHAGRRTTTSCRSPAATSRRRCSPARSAPESRVVLMDDPMRGVDIGTKQEVYGMIREEADKGRTFVWYTTEMDELANCDHVYVFRNGRIVASLARDEMSEEKVLQSSFHEDA